MQPPMPQKMSLPGVKHMIAVASGKGGVGKSTVAANLALALHASGKAVGLMDADVYGPSVAMMVGVEKAPTLTPERRIIPLERYGIRYVSMALFINDETAVIWRGPMVTKLETEFLFNVEWGELDCLVLDLPPGTGDAQLTITQRVALDGGPDGLDVLRRVAAGAPSWLVPGGHLLIETSGRQAPQAMAAFEVLCRTEGIIPALESSHALAGALDVGRELGPDALIVVNLSGRGDKDVDTASKWFGV